MASFGHRLHAWAHDSRSSNDARDRNKWVWLLTPVIVAVLVVAAAVAFASTQAPGAVSTVTTMSLNLSSSPPQPADVFMQSVAAENGELGWHQLCPDIQAHLPMAALVQQADTMRAQAAQAGVHVTVQKLGTRPQQGGWRLHEYRMTAQWANGAVRQWTFNVLTQPSGCVEDVQG